MWWKSAKLWIAVFGQLSAIVLLIVTILNPGEQVVQVVSSSLACVAQILAAILGAMWGNDYGTRKTEERLQ